jgi:hypothetical protein
MSAKMKRRDFITLLGGAAAWPLAARAARGMLHREPVVVRLTGSQSEPHRQTIGIDHRMYLAGQAAS